MSLELKAIKYRIKEIFDLIVDYPDSVPALTDLRTCLLKTSQHSDLVVGLKKSYVYASYSVHVTYMFVVTSKGFYILVLILLTLSLNIYPRLAVCDNNFLDST